MESRSSSTGLRAAAAFGAVWLVAGLAVEGSTFHLAPVIVTGAPVVVATRPLMGGVVGLGVVAIVAVLLEVAGRLDGPSLLPWGDATLETWAGALVGIAIGLGLAASGSVVRRG